MFNSGSSQSPFIYVAETLFPQYSYTYDQNPNSTPPADNFPCMLNFPSSSLDDHLLSSSLLPSLDDILPQQQPMAVHGDVVVDEENLRSKSNSIHKGENSSIESSADEVAMEPSPREVKLKPVRRRNLDATALRKRKVKKDRHSKISTAQGVRGRRMRLSLQIAREFFDLQDLLGFDKASNTIDWLFSKSKKAIKELSMNLSQKMENPNSTGEKSRQSTPSESEVIVTSSLQEYSNSEAQNGIAAEDLTNLVENPNEKINKELRNAPDHHNHHARESREKARARARERTREKMMIKGLEESKQWREANSTNSLDETRAFNPFEMLEESASHTQKSSSHEANCIVEKYLGTEDLTQIAELLLSPGIDSSTSLMGLLGNWDTSSTTINSSYGSIMSDMNISRPGKPTSTFPFLLL